MSRPMVHSAAGQVAAFLGAGDTVSIYPNAFDPEDTISICWSKSVDKAEKLANDILAAVRALRSHDIACPKCGSEAGQPCTKDRPEQVTEPPHPERLHAFGGHAKHVAGYGATGTATLGEVQPDAE